jgi:hypothetical protein
LGEQTDRGNPIKDNSPAQIARMLWVGANEAGVEVSWANSASGSGGASNRHYMIVNNVAGAVLAGAAAVSHWQMSLYFRQGNCAALDDGADLSIADGITYANVH